MKKKNVKKAPQKKAVKTKENTVTKSKLPAKKKVIIKRKSATRSMSFESVTGLHQEIIAVKASFVIEKFSDTKYCCMQVLPDGRREEHICYKTEGGARRHLENRH